MRTLDYLPPLDIGTIQEKDRSQLTRGRNVFDVQKSLNRYGTRCGIDRSQKKTKRNVI